MLSFNQFLINEKLAYLNKDEKKLSLVAAALCLECYKTARDFVFKKVNDTPFLAFRGTKSLQSWIYDLTPGITNDVWAGFNNFAQDLQNDIKPYLSLPNLIFTGHSLGATVAAIEYVEYCRQGNHGMLFTFGSPRIGNDKFLKKLFQGQDSEQIKKNAHFIYLSQGDKVDPVSSLPPNLPDLVNQFKEYLDIINLTNQDKQSLLKVLTGLHLHSMVNYQDSLESFLADET